MRKNIFGFDKLGGGLLCRYGVVGNNADALLKKLVKNGISVYSVQKKDAKTVILSIKYRDVKKFFAIIEELCYTVFDEKSKTYVKKGLTVKRIKTHGVLYPFYYLALNFGFILGAAIFILSSAFFSDLVFSIEFVGTGSVYEKDLRAYLSENDVVEFSRFSSLDLKRLGDFIVADNDEILFAECGKRGNRLIIDSVAKNKSVDILSGKADALVTDVDGVIESIKAYRGKAMFAAGDFVKKGDVLVSDVIERNEVSIKVNVIASATILYEKSFVYESEDEDYLKTAESLAISSFDDEIISVKTEINKKDNVFIFNVVLTAKKTFFVG